MECAFNEITPRSYYNTVKEIIGILSDFNIDHVIGLNIYRKHPHKTTEMEQLILSNLTKPKQKTILNYFKPKNNDVSNKLGKLGEKTK